jgi:hypothetical protein
VEAPLLAEPQALLVVSGAVQAVVVVPSLLTQFHDHVPCALWPFPAVPDEHRFEKLLTQGGSLSAEPLALPQTAQPVVTLQACDGVGTPKLEHCAAENSLALPAGPQVQFSKVEVPGPLVMLHELLQAPQLGMATQAELPVQLPDVAAGGDTPAASH